MTSTDSSDTPDRKTSKFDPSHGRQINTFKKAPPPKLGPAFGSWAGRDTNIVELPGGSALTFDLSKLTLADFRQMRWHPQINISLSILNFMFHQLEWQIIPSDRSDPKGLVIANNAEENLRTIWSQMVGSVNQSFWAGFAPTVIEWENNPNTKRIDITRFKDLVPEECEVNWKEVLGYAPPGKVRPKFRVYDGMVQLGGQGWPIPPEACVHPDTPVLCADLEWRPAGTLKVGQKIIAFDEEDNQASSSRSGRQYREAEIVVNNAGIKDSVQVFIDNGQSVTCSVDHPFLVRVDTVGLEAELVKPDGDGVTCLNCDGPITQNRNGARKKYCTEKCQIRHHRKLRKEQGVSYAPRWVWKDAGDLSAGDTIAWFGDPWEFDESREAGWLAGMFDGEGSLSFANGSAILSISQNSGPVLDRLKSGLAERGYDFHATGNDRDGCVQLVITGGRREIMRLLAELRPSRLLTKELNKLFDGVWITQGKSVDAVSVDCVSPVGGQPVASIQTSSGTFITGGALTHNTFWYPLLMENGDYYGRKLLKPAFTPWYFSTLIHLFANRYYERFGEPTPIGRAPYDSDVETPDGVITGREAMEQVMSNLRSRGVVTLPSDRDPVTKDFDYTLEYLESEMRGVDFDRYLGRLDEEMSLGMFTPILLFRSGEVGSNSLGVQHTQCVAAETPILCSDGRWVPACDLEVGTEVIAFDESPRREAPRRWRNATIEGNKPTMKHCFEVVTDVGPKIVASFDHPWLVERYGRHDWMESADLLPGDQIVYLRRGMERSVIEGESVYPDEDGVTGTEYATVVSTEDVGAREIASIKTSRGTFVTDGYLSHNTFLWMLNGIYGDIKYYIDRYVLKRWKDINYGPNAPDIEWSFHKMGRESQETLRAIINTLLSNDKVSVDLDELGQALGMTVKEVRQTQDDPGSDPSGDGGDSEPGSDVRQRDDKKGDGTRADNGEPRATGRQISARVGSQVRSAWKKATFDKDFEPSFGFERRMIESLVASGVPGDEAESRTREFYGRLGRAVSDLSALGMESFSGPSDVMAMVDRHIDFAIDEMLK